MAGAWLGGGGLINISEEFKMLKPPPLAPALIIPLFKTPRGGSTSTFFLASRSDTPGGYETGHFSATF